MMTTTTFPMDWDEFDNQFTAWFVGHLRSDRLRRTSFRIPGKNFMADEVMGTYHVAGPDGSHESGRNVEIATFVFPALGERPHRDERCIGLTFSRGGDDREASPVVRSFAELDEALGFVR